MTNHVWNGITVVERLSPNRSSRMPKDRVTALVLHADADDKVSDSIAWTRDDDSDVSYHLIVGRKGHAYLICPLDSIAWACGESEYPAATLEYKKKDGFGRLQKRKSVNAHTISLCFANLNDGKEPYSDAQHAVGAKLAAYLIGKFPAITVERITTHAVVALPPGRKTDPKGFDMERFKTLVRAELAQEHTTCA